MISPSLRDRDCLVGASNFTPWDCRMQILLEEVDLWSFV
jgi:hypothetical protein